jgi:secretion/DNA translocation related CpaE-like protein
VISARLAVVEVDSGPGAKDVAVVVADSHSCAAIVRLAAVAGVTAQPVATADASAAWMTATAVVVDAEAARACVAARLPRRRNVLVVAPDTAGIEVWSTAVALGASRVLAVRGEERLLADWLADVVEPDTIGRMVCCLPARGGAGASTLSSALALAGAQTREVLLLDADSSPGGIDYVLGIEDAAGARWPDLADAAGVLSAAALADALPVCGRVRVVSTGTVRAELRPAALEAVLGAGLRGHSLVVADCGREDVTQLVAAHAETVLVVVPADVRSVVSAAAVVESLSVRCRDIRLVVRHPGPGDLRPRDVADAVGAAVAAVWPWEKRLGAVVDGGTFAAGWRRTKVGHIATELLEHLVPDVT